MRSMRALLLAALALAGDPIATMEKHIAEGRYREALELLPACGFSLKCHLLASKAYDGLNDPAKAVAEAEAALALDPKSEAAHLQLGQIFLSRNTPQAAVEIFSEALALHPNSLLLRLGRGLALKELTRYDEAVEDLQACLARRPDFGLAFDALATIYLHTKRYAELSGLVETFRAQAPGEYRGPYFAAAALEGQALDLDEAARLARESIRLNPRFAAAHALLGKMLLEQNDLEGAIAALQRAVELRPDYGPALLNLAQAYRRAGRHEEAARMFDRLRALNAEQRKGRPSLRYRRGLR